MKLRHVRTAGWLGLAMFAAYYVLVLPSQFAAAQEPAAEPDPAAATAAEAADVAPAPDAVTAAPAPEQSVLEWIIHTSGWIGAVLLILSIYFVATVVRMFLELRSSVTLPLEVVEECENLLKGRDVQGVYKIVKADDSFFSNVMAAGMTELQHGLPEAREAIDRVSDAQTVEMEKKISMLAVLGTLGPMIGLLGTLKGMIGAFSVIAMSSGGQMDASAVAGNISEALVLTFEGVALSVPAIYFFALFRNRIASLTTEATLFADEFLRRVNGVMRGKPAPGGAAPMAAPAVPAT
ncbi:MAG: MotA/TolQ/ExbB proton channel family protein [Planctomycetaceae bacterium]|nr:MotA/TolQ/ExbB proton channel family protein [Planctomycetaceae bacterium]